MDPGEVWTYTTTGTAVVGNYVNVANVQGTASDGTTVVNDADPSRYVGVQNNPAIDIEKATNNQDADIAGTGPVVEVGDTVTFTYVVTNTGDVPLQNVVVTDDNGTTGDSTDDFSPTFVGGDADSDNQLDLTENLDVHGDQGQRPSASNINIGQVNAEDERGEQVNDTDPSNHTGIVRDIISKRRFLSSAG